MLRVCSFALLVLVVLPAAGLSADEKSDLQAFDGVWQPASALMAGQPLPADFLKAMKLEMDGGKYTVTIADKVDKGTFKLNSDAAPKTIDITGAEGPSAGKTLLGIYEFTGDTLRVCYDLSGKTRPTEFKSAPDAPYFVVSYQREKK